MARNWRQAIVARSACSLHGENPHPGGSLEHPSNDAAADRPHVGWRGERPEDGVDPMTWYGWLAIAVVITSLAAVTGIKPKGTQHLARTRMMGMARLALLIVVLIVIGLYVAGRVRSGG